MSRACGKCLLSFLLGEGSPPGLRGISSRVTTSLTPHGLRSAGLSSEPPGSPTPDFLSRRRLLPKAPVGSVPAGPPPRGPNADPVRAAWWVRTPAKPRWDRPQPPPLWVRCRDGGLTRRSLHGEPCVRLRGPFWASPLPSDPTGARATLILPSALVLRPLSSTPLPESRRSQQPGPGTAALPAQASSRTSERPRSWGQAGRPPVQDGVQ